jgi:8-oxo-dGTP pyrophosphatase MutT (NUDIX family)
VEPGLLLSDGTRAVTLADRLRWRLLESRGRTPALFAGDDMAVGDDALVPAAVLIAVTDRTEPGVLLTLRNANLRKHAGQVAFPGGRIDADDDGPIGAALREAEEEIGLGPHHVEVVGTSDPYRTGTGYLITPVIAVVPPDLTLSPHAAEVDAIFEPPLSHLIDPANYAMREAEWNGRTRHYRETFWNEYRIWGATASIMANLANRIGSQP